MYEGRGRFKQVTNKDSGKTGEICRWFLGNTSVPIRYKKKVVQIFNNMDSDADRDNFMDDVCTTIGMISLPRNAMIILVDRYSHYLTKNPA